MEKFTDQWNDAMGRVFDDIVAAVVESVDFGIGPVPQKPLEANRPKAPVAHAPDQFDRKTSQCAEPCFNSLQDTPCRMPRRKRNVAYESIDRDAIGPVV